MRGGVAPDHQGTKAIQRQFARILGKPGVRLLGNVTVGHDVTLAALRDAYDVVLHEGAEILDDFVQLAAGNPPKQLVEVAPGAGINTN